MWVFQKKHRIKTRRLIRLNFNKTEVNKNNVPPAQLQKDTAKPQGHTGGGSDMLIISS